MIRARTISRNIREGYYCGRLDGHHTRGEERFALRSWAPAQSWVCDKKEWGPGEWQHEPDRLIFRTPEGFEAAVLRARHSGSFCGYVGVPFGHPWWGKHYGDSVASTPEQLAAPVDISKISVISLFCMAGEGTEQTQRFHGQVQGPDRQRAAEAHQP
jgi:hypothetical protein